MSEEEQIYKIFITEEGVEKDFTRTDVVELLYNDVATVTFTKVDGSERVMECTLFQEILNERCPETLIEITEDPDDKIGMAERSKGLEDLPPPTESVTKGPNPNIVGVFDLVKNDWRSFRLDSVKSIGFPTSIHSDSGTVIPTFNEVEPVVDVPSDILESQPTAPPEPPPEQDHQDITH